MESSGFYLYGAGINCESVMRFFGGEGVIGIIDRNRDLVGKRIMGKPIISIEEFHSCVSNEALLITPYYAGREIKNELEAIGIKNIYQAPWMQNELFNTPKETISKLEIDNKKNICFYYKDPVSLVLNKCFDSNCNDMFFAEELDEKCRKAFEGNVVISVVIEESVFTTIAKEFPLAHIINLGNLKEAQIDKNDKLKRYKDIHKGERCFIIGNGPSITYKDLESLYEAGEICFGVNRVYLGFGNTSWRPDYYVVVDEKIIKGDLKEISNLSIPIFARKIPGFVQDTVNVNWFNALINPIDEIHFSGDICNGIYNGHTVIYEALQIAAYMGFTEILFLGVDMTRGISYQDEGAHFYRSPDKNENLGTGDQDRAIQCLRYGSDYLKKRNVCVKNSTRNVWWDDIPCVDFRSVISK